MGVAIIHFLLELARDFPHTFSIAVAGSSILSLHYELLI